jgi:hypothetical protein
MADKAGVSMMAAPRTCGSINTDEFLLGLIAFEFRPHCAAFCQSRIFGESATTKRCRLEATSGEDSQIAQLQTDDLDTIRSVQ